MRIQAPTPKEKSQTLIPTYKRQREPFSASIALTSQLGH